MKRLLKISRYPGILVFLMAGIAAIIVAYASLNLLNASMANLHFLREHGWLAVTSGGLVQLLVIILNGAIALLFFLVFKVCESELVLRYRRWQDR